MNTFQITTSLQDIYPDIENQLCSKQTVNLNIIQKKYKQLYPMYPPTHYTICNNVVSMLKTKKSSVSLALEQGVIIIFSAEQEGKCLYISSNIFQQQITLANNGKLLNVQKQIDYQSQVQRIIQLATEDMSLNSLNGGFLYIHCFDTINKKEMIDNLLIGLFMSIITINSMITQYEIDQLINKLQQMKQLQNCNLQAYFHGYNNRELLITYQESYKNVQMDNRHKFLFFKYNYIFSGHQIESYIDNNQQQTSIVEQCLSNDKMDLEELFRKVENVQKQKIGHHEAYKFINELRSSTKIKGFIFCEKSYCILLIESLKYAELIAKLSAIIRSKKNNPIQDQIITSRFKSDKHFNSILFSTVPSKSISILDPSDSIWF